MQGNVHGLRDDEEAGNLGTGLGLYVAVYAAGAAPVAGIFNREAVVRILFCEEVDVAFIAYECRHADSAADALQSLYQQFHRGALVNADGHGVVRQVGIFRGFQKQVGQLVGGIGAVTLYAADGPVVPFGHTGVLRAVCLAGYTVDLHALAAHDL